MKTTEKFGLTTYNTTDDKKVSNKDIFNSLESNFNTLDSEAARTINIPLVANENGAYSTTMTWEEIENGIEERDLLYIDIEDSILPLMVCDIAESGTILLFGYTNIINGTISTRAVECSYHNDTEQMEWRDIDRQIELGPQMPVFSEADNGKVLGIKDGKLVFAPVGDFNLY